MQLQKLVFFAHGAHLAAYEYPLVDTEVRAWDFGPVIPPLYERLREFGSGYVEPSLIDGSLRLQPSSTQHQAVRSVWEAYSRYDAWALSSISHQPGSPWDRVWNYGGRYSIIPDSLTRQYYQNRITRRNTDSSA
ncbi:Panacea domain-containing protein [Pseudomonas paraversuta]|uniref:Panacea domain-containing protein n=1 Tax=Pseudomonas paraversuta TaxID=2750624 RepID=UPI003D293A05